MNPRPGMYLIGITGLLLLLAIGSASTSVMHADAHRPTIHSGDPHNIAGRAPQIATLAARVHSGAVHIPFRPISGYLPGLLNALHVPAESQVAVFSRTSAQAPLISPENPRVIYFSDNIAVGWVRGSSVIEVAESDSNEGAVFYTVSQDAAELPTFTRDDRCRSCHQTERTLGVPGLLVLSTPDAYGAGGNIVGRVTDHRTPLRERWGGWYVTGRSSGWRHLGNRIGQGWLLSLYDQFYDDGYPAQYSDVVALMVLEHQTRLTNLLAVLAHQANGGATASELQQTVREVVDYMLFVDEAPFPAPIVGSSGFAEYFSTLGPQDSQGRSLRTFDLTSRLFRYPCSYMIYSNAFESLPTGVKQSVYKRLFTVLSSSTSDAKYARLTAETRRAIVEILSDTKPDFSRSQ